MRGGHLCDELIVDIFTRLPSKTLLRCRSLSKSWYSCIGSPDFIRMHTFRSQKKLLITHRSYNENEEGEFETLYTLHPQDQLPLCPTRGYIGITPLQFPSTYSVIVGSCDGIVCLFDYSDYRITLWNPSIRRTLILPDCPRRCYSEVEVAFGFDPVTDDYKIVRIPGVMGEYESSYVYTMKTNSWCEITSPMPVFYKVKTKACFVSGALHWLVRLNSKYIYHILTFDLSTHGFSHTASPHISRPVAPTAVQGSLAMIIDESSHDQWIWVRRVDSWSVEIKLEQNQDVGVLEGVLQLGMTGDLIFDLFPKGYQVYNSKTGSLVGLEHFNDAYFFRDVVQCVESLRLLDMANGC